MSESAFDPVTFRSLTAPNRIAVSPMCQYSCSSDGVATEWHRVHLGSRAVGGAGIVMTEATAVDPRGRITPSDLGIWTDEQADALAPIAGFISEQGAVPAIQLAHAGRKGSKTSPSEGSQPLSPAEGGWATPAPSNTPYPHNQEPPAIDRLRQSGIEAVIDSFRAAAQRANNAGFQIAEVHAAHGYLLHQFLSPVTNNRSDEYGGSYENRTRLVEEVTAAVRSVWPDEAPVFVRISATDWLPDRESWTVADSVRLAPRLADVGADLIDVSAGGIHPDQQVPNSGPNYQVPYAERIRNETGVPVGAVGKLSTGEQIEALIANERADLAFVGREHLRDPYFALHAAAAVGKADPEAWPVQYRRGLNY